MTRPASEEYDIINLCLHSNAEALTHCLSDDSFTSKIIAPTIVDALAKSLSGDIAKILLSNQAVLDTLQGTDIDDILRRSNLGVAKVVLDHPLCRDMLHANHIQQAKKHCSPAVIKEMLQHEDLVQRGFPEFIKHRAAIKIQALVRGMQAKARYHIRALAKERMTDYHLMPLGNDPKTMKFSKEAGETTPFALVATSGLRAIELACQVKGDNPSTPKLYIVDNSKNIHDLWQAVKHVFTYLRNAIDIEIALQQTVYELPIYQRTFRDWECTSTSPDKLLNLGKFLKTLFDKYSFATVKRIINNTALIRGDWTNTATFHKIKRICDRIGIDRIYAYPSNIGPCLDTKADTDRLLDSIEALKPTKTLHTNLCPFHGKPEKSFVYDGSGDRASVKSDLQLNNIGLGVGGMPSDMLLELMMLQRLLGGNVRFAVAPASSADDAATIEFRL